MNRPSDRYLSIEDRDFFAVYTRVSLVSHRR